MGKKRKETFLCHPSAFFLCILVVRHRAPAIYLASRNSQQWWWVLVTLGAVDGGELESWWTAVLTVVLWCMIVWQGPGEPLWKDQVVRRYVYYRAKQSWALEMSLERQGR